MKLLTKYYKSFKENGELYSYGSFYKNTKEEIDSFIREQKIKHNLNVKIINKLEFQHELNRKL